MTDHVATLVERIRKLEAELAQELASRRKTFAHTVEHRRIVFESSIARKHAALKQRLLPYIAGARPLVVLTAPVIYSMILPFVLLDVFMAVYQAICFPIYRIEKVQRTAYITFDRKHLGYLNGLEKLNCIYCSYGNGLLAYAREISARTEKHWCPIKHARRIEGAHRHYSEFLEYGDAEGYRRQQLLPVRDTPK